MSSRWEVDLRPRSRSACSNCRIRARTGMEPCSADGAAPSLEQAAQRGREVERLDVAARERVEKHLHALLGRQAPIEEHHVLAVHPTEAAPDPVADFAEKDLLPNLHAEPRG